MLKYLSVFPGLLHIHSTLLCCTQGVLLYLISLSLLPEKEAPCGLETSPPSVGDIIVACLFIQIWRAGDI